MDIVSNAINDAEQFGGTSSTIWEIRFTDGSKVSGTLTQLSSGYRIDWPESDPTYFSASQVVRLRPMI